MEYRIEDGDPLLRLRCSIITNLNTSIYIIVQQIKLSSIYITQMGEGCGSEAGRQ